MHGFETLAIHAGQEPDPRTGAVVPPIYATSTYAQDGVGGTREGYEYSRTANPTRTSLEECLATLEGGSRGFAFASGMAAEDTLLRAVLEPGDHIVIPNDAYGGTYRLVSNVIQKWATTPREVLTREHLLAEVWDWPDASGTRTVDSHVRALRAKVGPGRVRTVHGVGYALAGRHS